jgi:hypothetical protein
MNFLVSAALTCALALCLPQDSSRTADPTVRDPRLERALETAPVEAPHSGVAPARTATAEPVVELRGLVVGAQDAAGAPGRIAAVISIDGTFARVEPGTTIGGVRVAAVGADGVRIEFTTTGASALLR